MNGRGAKIATGVRPDAQHGLVTFTNIRTEADPRDLQQPPAFARSQVNLYGIAVAPEGKRVAKRVAGAIDTVVRWWPIDEPGSRR